MIPIRAALPTTTEARALLAAYRRGTGVNADRLVAEVADTEPDAGLVDPLADPFSSVDDVAERLARAESRLRDRGDRRSVFLTVYVRMTEAVAAAIEAGEFVDDEWVASYLVAFAEHYRRAFLAFERREFDALPRAWIVAFGAAARGDTLVAQDALLGINAHISYDLTYTLRDVGIDPDRGHKRADHDRINDVLARLVSVVQEALVEVYDAAGVAGVDALFDPLDDRIALLGLKGSREFAWRNAVSLADLPPWIATGYVGWRARTVSTGVATLIATPRIDPEDRRRLEAFEANVPALTEFRDEFRRRTASMAGDA
ncbi:MULTISPECIES: DUF5995 family protein [Haloferacaceae]|uniref:DUF5995 family protein n=1 Tax=Halorubrum glutamatedens TaxID=2707018 RepID=A0ABD5QPC6_9EURY|nr:DUF5995 family protein [Halobellus captivus]